MICISLEKIILIRYEYQYCEILRQFDNDVSSKNVIVFKTTKIPFLFPGYCSTM